MHLYGKRDGGKREEEGKGGRGMVNEGWMEG